MSDVIRQEIDSGGQSIEQQARKSIQRMREQIWQIAYREQPERLEERLKEYYEREEELARKRENYEKGRLLAQSAKMRVANKNYTKQQRRILKEVQIVAGVKKISDEGIIKWYWEESNKLGRWLKQREINNRRDAVISSGTIYNRFKTLSNLQAIAVEEYGTLDSEKTTAKSISATKLSDAQRKERYTLELSIKIPGFSRLNIAYELTPESKNPSE